MNKSTALPCTTFPSFGKAAFGVLVIEIHPAAAEPPAFYEIAVQSRI